MSQKLHCPRCGYANPSNEVACPQCRISLVENDRLEGAETHGAARPELPAYGLPPPVGFEAAGWPPVRSSPVAETTPTGEIWNYREFLVCTRGVSLPPFCVACDSPTTRRHSLGLVWYPKWVLFFFVIPALGILVFLFNIQRSKIEIGLCDAHWRVHIRNTVAGNILAILGSGGVVYQFSAGPSAIGLISSLGVFLLGSILALWSSTFIFPRAHKMNPHYIWLTRISGAFRERFPRVG